LLRVEVLVEITPVLLARGNNLKQGFATAENFVLEIEKTQFQLTDFLDCFADLIIKFGSSG
jgi:hypothetical protein